MIRNLTILPFRQRGSSQGRGNTIWSWLSLDRASLEQTEVCVLQTPTHDILWSGFLYVDGKPSGIESVRHFAEELTGGIAQALTCLKGVYMIAVSDRLSESVSVFVDSSGLFNAFYSSLGVSSSFLALAAEHRLNFQNLSQDALVQFFHFGYISFGATFSPEINRLDGEHIVSISSTGTVSLTPKNSRALELAPEHDFEALLKNLATSASNQKVSIDLTGGIDSRLLAVALEYFGLPFELAVSGSDEDDDVTIACEIAEILNRPIFVTHHEISDFENSLPSLLEVCDGLFDVTKGHGPLQNQRERRDRGSTLMLTGAGGELFKDFWWLQDFPFYGRRNSDLNRLYLTRIVPVEPRHDYLSNKYAATSHGLQDLYLQKLASYVAEDNTHTYDRVYYFVKMRDLVGRLMANHAWLLHCYAPYLEPEIATVGYMLPRSMRLFNRFHRRMITRYGRRAARVPTTEGRMSVSSELGALPADLTKFVVNRMNRLVRKLGQKLFRRRVLERGPTNPAFYRELQQSSAMKLGFERLKGLGILRKDLALAEIEPSYCGNILSLSMFLDWIENRGKPLDSAEVERLA